jgi:Tol biopolymer transport system component
MVAFRTTVAVVAFMSLLASVPSAGPEFDDWSPPENLGPVINSSFNDAGPAVSSAGSLYFNSDRPDGEGGNDIWVAPRRPGERSWGTPINIGSVVNTPATEAVPRLSRDGHWLFFNSNRSGGLGELDIWASYRWDTQNDFGWLPPVNVGSSVNSPAFDTTVSYFENGRTSLHQIFLASNRPDGVGAFDIYVSTLLPDGTFGAAVLVPELSSPLADPGLTVSSTGLEVFLFSNRTGTLGGQDLWVATRKTLSHPWSTPVNLGPLVNSTVVDSNPYISANGRSLFFQSDRPGGLGGNDLYVTNRRRSSE